MGVFATRSPFRPNPLGLSCVRLDAVETSAADGPVLVVRGADLMDGTPIYDIKPYLPYADAYPDARGGFAGERAPSVRVEIPPELLALVPEDRREALVGVLSQDPRPRYQDDPARLYGMAFAGLDVRFRVAGGTVYVTGIVPRPTR